jgi:hypothetical protein
MQDEETIKRNRQKMKRRKVTQRDKQEYKIEKRKNEI